MNESAETIAAIALSAFVAVIIALDVIGAAYESGRLGYSEGMRAVIPR